MIVLGSREDVVYWKLIETLIIQEKYRILNISEEQDEIWLENISNKKFPFIKISRLDLDWSNFLKRDLEAIIQNGKNVRTTFLKRDFSILNIYVSELLPVDDFEHIFEQGKTLDSRIKVESMIICQPNLYSALNQLSTIFSAKFDYTLKEEYEWYEVESIKREILTFAFKEAKKEKDSLTVGRPFFTNMFLGIQIAMFILLELAGGSQNPYVLIEYGAKFNQLIVAGEWWRFITPIFLHIGILHLLMNSLALYYLGSIVEKIYGSGRFLFIYLFSGFLGALGSFIFNPSISAGASGAIFGCFGALLYFGTIHPSVFLRTLGSNIIVLLGINLIFGFVVPSIDNAGHIGGLIGGFLAAGIVHLPKSKKLVQQGAILVITLIITAAALYYGYQNPNLF